MAMPAQRSSVDVARRILGHLRERSEEMIDLLIRFAEAESPSTVPESQRPVLDLIAERLRGCGFRVSLTAGSSSGGCLRGVTRHRPRGRAIQLLLGHGDTVWPLGTLRQMPVGRQDGRLFGPGVFDMKGGLVQMLFALDALRLLGLEPMVPPVVFVNTDEETGSGESTHHIRRLARLADRVFVVEPALGPLGHLKTARKGVGRFVVHVQGRAAHAGLDPEQGASAILELAYVVQRLFQLNDPERGITVNVGTINGGLRPNVIAPESTATVDVRILHQGDAARIEAAIRGIAATTPGTQVRVEGAIRRPPLERTPGNLLLWERARAAAEELGLALDEATAGGGSDGNTTSQLAPTLDGLGAVGGGAHAPEEFVFEERLPERAALLARLLLDPPVRAR
jgi:glutamate carboxypeptidase